MVSPLRVDFKILVRRTPERVYEAMTTAKGLDGWFTTNSIVNALPGGSIRFRWKDWGQRSTLERTEDRFLKQFGQVGLCSSGSQIQACL